MRVVINLSQIVDVYLSTHQGLKMVNMTHILIMDVLYVKENVIYKLLAVVIVVVMDVKHVDGNVRLTTALL